MIFEGGTRDWPSRSSTTDPPDWFHRRKGEEKRGRKEGARPIGRLASCLSATYRRASSRRTPKFGRKLQRVGGWEEPESETHAQTRGKRLRPILSEVREHSAETSAATRRIDVTMRRQRRRVAPGFRVQALARGRGGEKRPEKETPGWGGFERGNQRKERCFFCPKKSTIGVSKCGTTPRRVTPNDPDGEMKAWARSPASEPRATRRRGVSAANKYETVALICTCTHSTSLCALQEGQRPGARFCNYTLRPRVQLVGNLGIQSVDPGCPSAKSEWSFAPREGQGQLSTGAALRRW